MVNCINLPVRCIEYEARRLGYLTSRKVEHDKAGASTDRLTLFLCSSNNRIEDDAHISAVFSYRPSDKRLAACFVEVKERSTGQITACRFNAEDSAFISLEDQDLTPLGQELLIKFLTKVKENPPQASTLMLEMFK